MSVHTAKVRTLRAEVQNPLFSIELLKVKMNFVANVFRGCSPLTHGSRKLLGAED